MRTSQLPNLRGLIANGAQLKIQIVKAINQAASYAKRGPGYSPAALDLQEVLQESIDALRTWTRAASISALPATTTLDISDEDTEQIEVTATYEDGETADVTADSRTTYATSDATKATVSASGLITPVAAGSATITVTHQGRTDTIAVTVQA